MRPGRRLGLLAALALLAPAAPGRAATYAFLDSAPGDYVGSGMQQTLVPANGFAVTRGFDNTLTVTQQFPRRWTFRFRAPGGAVLAPGAYEGATRFGSATAPTLEVSGASNGCNAIAGRFDVLEVAYAADGRVERLAVDFAQHCDGSAYPLRGRLRFRSTLPEPDRDSDGVIDMLDDCPEAADPDQADADGDGKGDACDAIEGATFVALDSQPGDPVGDGIDRFHTRADEEMLVHRHPGGGVTIGFAGFVYQFAPPLGRPFLPGVYEGAELLPFQIAPRPGMNVIGPHTACYDLTGRFEILEAVYRNDGEVISLAIDFEQHCDGAPPALFGMLRFNAESVPASVDEDGDRMIDAADNCRSTANPDQADGDADRIGDACDLFPEAADNLGVCVETLGAAQGDAGRLADENALLQVENEALRAALADADGDGVPDSLDRCPQSAPEGAVDAAGCSLAEFCSAWPRRATCAAADWGSDEAVTPRDCRWLRASGCRPF
jgi:hypothetical protein